MDYIGPEPVSVSYSGFHSLSSCLESTVPCCLCLHIDEIISTFEEFENTGPGSNTSARVQETVATAAVTKEQLWPNGQGWIDSTY